MIFFFSAQHPNSLLAQPLASTDDDVDDDGCPDDGGDGVEWEESIVTGQGANQVT